MQIKYLVNWLKLFVVSFVVAAVGRIWFEEYAFGSVKSYGSVALFAGIVAIAIATAQAVLAPRPKPDMRARMAAPLEVSQAYVEPTIPVQQEPVFSASKSSSAKKKTIKKKIKKSKRK